MVVFLRWCGISGGVWAGVVIQVICSGGVVVEAIFEVVRYCRRSLGLCGNTSDLFRWCGSASIF